MANQFQIGQFFCFHFPQEISYFHLKVKVYCDLRVSWLSKKGTLIMINFIECKDDSKCCESLVLVHITFYYSCLQYLYKL